MRLGAKVRLKVGASTTEIDRAADLLATVLTASPNLRARLFANPTKEVGRQLPPRRYWDYRIDPYLAFRNPLQFFAERRLRRALLAEKVLGKIAQSIKDHQLSATVSTDAVFEDFFAPVVRVSQQSFTGVFALSVAAFLVGCGLIGAGIYVAICPPSSGNSTVLGSIFGGSGAVSALGSVYAMTIRGIRDAAGDRAKLQLVLTGFATQLGQLRAYAEAGPETTPAPARDPQILEGIRKVNDAIRQAMTDAANLMPSSGAAPPAVEQPQSVGAGDSGDVTST